MVSSAEGEEVMTLDELIARFEVEHLSLGGPVFDVPKLDWLNGKRLRELPPDAFVERIFAWGGDPQRFAAMAALAQSRIERLSDLGPLLAFFFAGRLGLTEAQLLRGEKLDRENTKNPPGARVDDVGARRRAASSTRRRLKPY